jgi:hypothetical protein
MSHPQHVQIVFSSKHADLRKALSAVVHTGNSLWVVNDETTHLERFSADDADESGNPVFAQHTRFAMADYLDLPAGEGKEIDTEGLAFQDGYLWLMGSHSMTREKPDDKDEPEKIFRQLASTSREGNRYLLARIPLDDQGALQTRVQQGNVTLHAARLCGDTNGNELTEALASDPHLQASLTIPCKENGLDIEGLAVSGERVFLGLRGPVLRGWACILELQLQEDSANPALLRLSPIGENGQLYRKHFLKLDGLGVRDLCVQDDDLLILAGPTMSAEGAERVYRWRGGANPAQESAVDGKALPLVLELPVSEDNHPEGICLFPTDNGRVDLLVVCDPAADDHLPDKKTVNADLYALDS